MKNTTDLVSRVFLELDRLLPTEVSHVLCAFSGGADSACLLTLLFRYAQAREKPLNISAAHIHHGIRGEEADKDAMFCRQFCEERGIRFFLDKLDVPLYAKQHQLGLEEAARLLRYAALRRICQAEQIPLIVTAHNATDQLETVLMHLTRGCGIDGLCGMPEKAQDLIRPLLTISKEEILAFCQAEQILYVTDSTNFDTAMTRNRLRADVLPILSALNPRAEQACLTMTRSLCEDRDFLDRLAASHSLQESRSVLRELENPILSRVLRREFRMRFPHAPMLTHLHCENAIAAIRSQKTGMTVTLPGNSALVCDRELVFLVSRENETPLPDPIVLHEGWQTFSKEDGIILVCTDILTEADTQKIAYFKNIYNLSNTMTLNSATIHSGITVRIRQEGDTYFDGRHTRNVRKLLQSTALPLSLRIRYPIFCDASGILWVPGFEPRADIAAQVNKNARIFCFFGRRRETAQPSFAPQT